MVEIGEEEDALALSRAMMPRFPDHAVLRWNASLAALQLGQFEDGWRDYESRWQVPGHDPPRADARLPDPATIRGQRILLLREQGRGDVLQFVRYAPLLAERGALVSLSVTDDLKPLLAGMVGLTAVVGEDEAEPKHDIVIPLMSLPLVFGTTLATIPAPVPYIQADPARAAVWRSRLGGEVGRPAGPRANLRVGLVWSSTNPGAQRSTTLRSLRPLLDCPLVSFHALQPAVSAADRVTMAEQGRITDHSAGLTDFAETAALIDGLDLVISIDTAVAHLAGAMGKPTWIMLPYRAEWRWLRDRNDSPWYPAARLFRQPARGD